MKTIKLSQNTRKILKNFATINHSLYIYPGNRIKTVSDMKTVVAEYETEEEFPIEFGIYDLQQFLQIVSLFEDPEIEFEDSYALVKNEDYESKFFYANKNTFRNAPKPKEYVFPDEFDTFVVNEDQIKRVIQGTGILQLPEICFYGDGDGVYLQAIDSRNSNCNTFSIRIGDTTKKYKAIFNLENFKIRPETYEVVISSQKVVQFRNEKLSYIVVCEAISSYED